ncbi:MAG: 30S ribosome-binding factor RbfA [Verrucomicrobiae bacterium]|nr:30S ribosome-binding factor RbfA [Verrucomicrobiae bacterium]
MSTFRLKRVNEMMKHELSELIRSRLRVSDYGVITVTDVEVAKDLKTAQVYISAVGVEGQTRVDRLLAALEAIRPELQHEMSRKVILKYTPHLQFCFDEGMARGQQVLKILDELERGDKPSADLQGEKA